MMRFNQPTVNDLMNRFRNEFTPGFEVEQGYKPAVNIYENDEAFSLEFMVPGRSKKDFVINLENEYLTVSAEAKQENDAASKGYSRKEFTCCAFSRSFTLPDTVKTDKITAAYENGILTITLPKKDEAKPLPARMIEIK